MKSLKVLTLALALAAYGSALHAENISYFGGVITATSPAQSGRLSRNGIAQDWLGDEPFPGVLNTTTSYNYTTYTFAASLFQGAPYIEISFFDSLNGVSLFSSAYSTSYDPKNIAANWLGDEGSSGNYFGTDARFYDVYLNNAPLVLVVNTSAAAGLGDPFVIDVSAYADSNYNDPASVTPEPSTFALLASGVAGVAGIYRRRRNAERAL